MPDLRLKFRHTKQVVVSSLVMDIKIVGLVAQRPTRCRPWIRKRDTRAFVDDAKGTTEGNAQETVKLVGAVPQAAAFLQQGGVHVETLFLSFPMQAYINAQAQGGTRQVPQTLHGRAKGDKLSYQEHGTQSVEITTRQSKDLFDPGDCRAEASLALAWSTPRWIGNITKGNGEDHIGREHVDLSYSIGGLLAAHKEVYAVQGFFSLRPLEDRQMRCAVAEVDFDQMICSVAWWQRSLGRWRGGRKFLHPLLRGQWSRQGIDADCSHDQFGEGDATALSQETRLS